MTKTRKREDIVADIKALEMVEYHVETNQGTYGPDEACRKVGCGDPQFANREVYETVGGKRRETGPAEVDAPGRMRQINRQAMTDARKQIVRLRTELRAVRE